MSVSFFVSGVDEDLNLSNSNFDRLCSSLGIEFSYAGTIQAEDLERRLDYLAAQLEHNTTGFSPTQILHYYSGLTLLVVLAKHENKHISWG
jgi:hypothetical protein